MRQISRIEYRILYVETNEITLLDIPRSLDELGYDVYKAVLGIKAQEYDDTSYRKIFTAIDKFHIHCVISYDFIPVIAQACLEADVPYIAWVYDCPQKELYTHYALYPGNYIFAFDKEQVKDLKRVGIDHAVYMPLAVHESKIRLLKNAKEKENPHKYKNDITFIGQLYRMENETAVFHCMPEDIKTQLQQNIDGCFMKWEKGFRFHGQMSDDCAECFGELEGHMVRKEFPYMSEKFYYEAAFLSRAIANRERVHVLNKLAEKYDVKFYTKDKDTSQLSPAVKILPGMGYDELFNVYAQSKININITLHCIQTGACQRIFDVLAAGGFLLTNYQEELEELFVPGEELVFYHNEQELLELAEYYLTHEEERERIAANGQKKVLEKYTFGRVLPEVIDYVAGHEEKREEKYIVSQQKFLREQADLLLAEGTEASCLKLYELYTDKLYETAIRKDTEIGTLREMLECWQRERELGTVCIFDNVTSVKEAEQKYLRLKHGLWRVEQGLSHDKCMTAVECIRNGSISKFFAVWCVFANLRDKEETVVKVAALMAESSIPEAIEFLSYGLLLFRNSAMLLSEKASYFMDLNLWQEALKTLKQIENPDEEIRAVINDLELAFQELQQ